MESASILKFEVPSPRRYWIGTVGFPEEEVLLLLDAARSIARGSLCQENLNMAKRLPSYKGGLASGPFW